VKRVRIVQLRGYLIPRAARNGRHQQLASYQAECPCGWRGVRFDTEREAGRQAMGHRCQP